MEKEYELELERPDETERRYGKGKSGCWEDVESELLTPTFPIGKRSVARFAHETTAIIALRGAGGNDDEVRALVRALLAARSELRGLARELIPITRASSGLGRKRRGSA